ncbi:MAG: hypothetical protein AB7O55_09270 [Lautropia sp.]
MRTPLILLAGFLLMAATFILARLFVHDIPAALTWATAAYLVIWLLITAFNMWVGVAKAGYTAREEFPILLMLFGIPAVVALLLRWKVL